MIPRSMRFEVRYLVFVDVVSEGSAQSVSAYRRNDLKLMTLKDIGPDVWDGAIWLRRYENLCKG